MRKTLPSVLAALALALSLALPTATHGAATASVPVPGVWVASAGSHQVTWAWSAVRGATGYRVAFSRYSNLAGAKVTITTKRSFLHTGLTSGSSYFVAVRAVTAGGTSARSKIVRGLAGAVPKPNGTAVQSHVVVDWRWGPYAGAAKYLAQQSTSPTFTVHVNSHVVSARSIALRVSRGSWGYLRVKPLNSAGETLTDTWSLIGACYMPYPPVVGPTS